MMLPAMDALTSSTWPWRSATMRDDQLGGVAERGIQEPAEAGPERSRQFLGAETDDARQRNQRHGRGEKDPWRFRQPMPP